MRRSLLLSFGLLLASCRASSAPPRARDAGAPSAVATPTRAPDAALVDAVAPALVTAAPSSPDSPATAQAWIEVFYPGWAMPGRPPAAIDWSNVTDVVLFGLVPAGDRVEAASTGLTSERIAAARAAARTAGASVLVCLGGERTGRRFRASIDVDGGTSLAASVGAFVEEHDLDGVVIDIEPLAEVPAGALVGFVRHLRKRLEAGDARSRRLEAVVAPDAREVARLAPIASELGRVAVMSYLGAATTPERERELLDALVAIGFGRANVGVGLDGSTTTARTAQRTELVRTGAAGGVILWHAGTLCERAAGGARCSPAPEGLRR